MANGGVPCLNLDAIRPGNSAHAGLERLACDITSERIDQLRNLTVCRDFDRSHSGPLMSDPQQGVHYALFRSCIRGKQMYQVLRELNETDFSLAGARRHLFESEHWFAVTSSRAAAVFWYISNPPASMHGVVYLS